MNKNALGAASRHAVSNVLSRLKSRDDWRVILALSFIVFVVSGAISYRRIAFPTDNDYSLHVHYAELLADGSYEDIPLNALAHPALQLILTAMHLGSLRILGLYASLMIVQTLVHMLTALVIYFWLGSGRDVRWNWLRAFIAASLTIVSPIMILASADGLFYFGYVGLANYHNPTIHLLRPAALLSFIMAIRVFRSNQASIRFVTASAVLIAISGAIKPNYAMTLLPALGVMALIQLRKTPIDWRLLIVGFAVPGILTLTSQWIVAYWMARGEQISILFRPLQVEAAFSDFLLLKLLLSILFPLTALIFSFRPVTRDVSIQLSWIAFIAGGAQMYLLAEGGDRFFHGNFRWSAQVALFLLFVTTARLMYRQAAERKAPPGWRNLITYATYLAHLGAGVAYYLRSFLSKTYA